MAAAGNALPVHATAAAIAAATRRDAHAPRQGRPRVRCGEVCMVCFRTRIAAAWQKPNRSCKVVR
jgi:hypothetical protein